jgi:HSP20 family protein
LKSFSAVRINGMSEDDDRSAETAAGRRFRCSSGTNRGTKFTRRKETMNERFERVNGTALAGPLGSWLLDFPVAARGVSSRRQPTRAFPLDVLEYEDRYEIAMEAPGVTSDRIAIEREGDHLTIEIAPVADKPEGAKFLHRERSAGESTVKRVVRLSERAANDAEASLKDGVLRVRIAKVPELLPKRITITTEQ